jgi:nucleotide-binding universal stress UspA family protein
MPYKCILVPIDGVPHDRFALHGALGIAQLQQGHVTALLPLPPHVDERSAIFGGEGLALASTAVERELAGAERRRRATAQRVFEEALHEMGAVEIARPGEGLRKLSGALQVEEGFAADTLARVGPLHDLVVFARGPKGTDEQAADSLLLETALLRVGRPVLLMPKALPASFPSQVAIAWSGSTEGAHAVSAALPFLAMADNVRILTVDGRTGSPDSAALLVDYLRWHGIPSVIEADVGGHGDPGTAVLSRATDLDSDLLIMGGYTHGPLRQAIFGGVTDHVLRYATMPVLMAH